MSSRTVSLERSAYERLLAAKRPGESFSDTVNRILESSRPSFRVLAGILTSGEAARVRNTVREMWAVEREAENARAKSFPGRRHGRQLGH